MCLNHTHTAHSKVPVYLAPALPSLFVECPIPLCRDQVVRGRLIQHFKQSCDVVEGVAVVGMLAVIVWFCCIV